HPARRGKPLRTAGTPDPGSAGPGHAAAAGTLRRSGSGQAPRPALRRIRFHHAGGAPGLTGARPALAASVLRRYDPPDLSPRRDLNMTEQERTELEAAAFRRLVQHLRSRPDAQNIDLMNLAGFCRNCLSKWYKAAADDRDIEVSLDEAREDVYGMPYAEWKRRYQKEATPEQQAAFDKGQPS